MGAPDFSLSPAVRAEGSHLSALNWGRSLCYNTVYPKEVRFAGISAVPGSKIRPFIFFCLRLIIVFSSLVLVQLF
jgi:hypothetical protein